MKDALDDYTAVGGEWARNALSVRRDKAKFRKSLAMAVGQIKDPPCVRHNCQFQQQCRETEVCCPAFRAYASNNAGPRRGLEMIPDMTMEQYRLHEMEVEVAWGERSRPGRKRMVSI